VTLIATAFNKEYPDLPNLDPGTGYAQPEPEPGAEGVDPEAPPAAPDAMPDPDAEPAEPDEPPPDLDEDGDATDGMDDEEKSAYKRSRRGLRRLLLKNLQAQIDRRRLAGREREQVARVADRLAERPGSRSTATWAAKELRAALAAKSPPARSQSAGPVPELDTGRIDAALAPLLEKFEAQRRELAGITGKG
jgi:hypothetical protein